MSGGALKPAQSPISFKSEELRTNLQKRLKEIDNAVFDFDGTVYPRLFVFDVTKRTFDTHAGDEKYKKKLGKLNDIATVYAGGDFKGAYAMFLDLLKGEDRAEFVRNAKELMTTSSYPYAKRTIEKLRDKYGIKAFMISLTADFIGDQAREHFGFERVFSVGYLSEHGRFTGNTSEPVEHPEEMKSRMLTELDELRGGRGKYVCFFDSGDDLPVAESAALKVGVNPKPKLLEQVTFDVALNNKEKDPWEEFYKLL